MWVSVKIIDRSFFGVLSIDFDAVLDMLSREGIGQFGILFLYIFKYMVMPIRGETGPTLLDKIL